MILPSNIKKIMNRECDKQRYFKENRKQKATDESFEETMREKGLENLTLTST